MSTPSPPPGDSERAETDEEHQRAESSGTTTTPEDRAGAGEALRASFARLSPQGSDEWNFMGAFTHLGDRYGPYQPGTSDLADLLEPKGRRVAGGRLGRGRGGSPGAPADATREQTEVEEAMTHVVEAFRFLHARVSTLEARLAVQDVPLQGAAWLAPARELDGWVEPIAAHLRAQPLAGPVVHADCGEGSLVRVLNAAGTVAYGVEPRGGVALRALEDGCSVTICEIGEHLGTCDPATLGGIVLSGVVDRLPLHALIPLLAQCHRALADGASLIVVSEPGAAMESRDPTSGDLVEGKSLHAQTWELLLQRTGFVDIAMLPAGAGQDRRFGISAATPTS